MYIYIYGPFNCLCVYTLRNGFEIKRSLNIIKIKK